MIMHKGKNGFEVKLIGLCLTFKYTNVVIFIYQGIHLVSLSIVLLNFDLQFEFLRYFINYKHYKKNIVFET